MRRGLPVDPPKVTAAPFSGGAILLWLGGSLFLISMVAGVVRSMQSGHWLPPVAVEYTTELDALVQARGSATTLPEVRIAAKIDFDNEQAVNRLLENARAANNSDDELWALLALARLNPEDGRVRTDLALALLEQGRPADAYAQARFAVWLVPDSSEPFCHLGAALRQLGYHQQAAAAYRRALDIEPTSATARAGLQSSLAGS